MNVLFATISFGICSCIGLSYGNRYRKTHLFWNDFLQFNQLAKIQIKTFSCPIEKIIEIIPKGEFKSFAESALKTDATLPFPAYLLPDEKEYLSSYFYQLQRMDFIGISAFLESAAAYLTEQEKKSKLLSDKNVKFSKKLGILSGLALFILMV